MALLRGCAAGVALRQPPARQRAIRRLSGGGTHDRTDTVSVSKTRIEIMTRARFTGAQVRRDYLKVGLWLKRRVESPRFTKVEHLGQSDWLYYFDIRDESDIDDELLALLRESRTVGDQRS
ncbi:MAG: DUF5655 domain-containing protein [Candidatus Limnocylindria bacterium]